MQNRRLPLGHLALRHDLPFTPECGNNLHVAMLDMPAASLSHWLLNLRNSASTALQTPSTDIECATSCGVRGSGLTS